MNGRGLMPDKNSPCVRNCCLDEDDICLGCFRSIDEILQWGSAGEELRQQILSRVKERRSLRENQQLAHWPDYIE